MMNFNDAARAAAEKVIQVVGHVLEEHPDVFEKTSETSFAMRDIARLEVEKVFQPLAELNARWYGRYHPQRWNGCGCECACI
jgi:hypothetical protein